MTINLEAKYYAIADIKAAQANFTIVKEAAKGEGGAVAFLRSLKHQVVHGRAFILGANVEQDATIHEIAKRVYEGYQKKMGFFCRLIDNIKRKFGKGNPTRLKVERLFNRIINLPEVKYQPLAAVPISVSPEVQEAEKKIEAKIEEMDKERLSLDIQAKETEKKTRRSFKLSKKSLKTFSLKDLLGIKPKPKAEPVPIVRVDEKKD